jgi:hypothetical protein
MNKLETPKYPLLEAMLTIKNLPLQPTYSTRSVAQLFNVSMPAIQNRVSSGQLVPRDLPGQAKFLPQDVEESLTASRKRPHELLRGRRLPPSWLAFNPKSLRKITILCVISTNSTHFCLFRAALRTPSVKCAILSVISPISFYGIRRHDGYPKPPEEAL